MASARVRTDKMDILNGPMLKNMIRYTLPLIATGILQLLYNTADNIVVGRYDGSVALAAVGSTGSLINLIVNVCVGLAVGSSVAVAQEYGAGNDEGVSEVVHTSLVISTIGGIVVALIGYFFASDFLVLMGSPEDVLPLSTLYLKIYFLGTPASMIYNFCASILRSAGDTKRPLYFLTISGIVNVILNLVFVIQFHMGVAGVAWATIISQYLSLAMVLVYMFRLPDCCRIRLNRLCIKKDKLMRIVRVGIPAGLQSSVFSISNVIIQSSINSFNSTVMAGSTAASQLEGFVYITMNSVSQASLTFTGQNVGAGRTEKLHRVMLMTSAIVTVIGLVLGISIYICGVPLLKIYLPKDPEAIEYGLERLLMVCAPYFLCGLMEVMVGCQRGMGMSVTPMIVSTLGACGTRIVWIYTIFAKHRTLKTLFISYPISWFITTAVHFVFYMVCHNNLVRRMENEKKLVGENV